MNRISAAIGAANTSDPVAGARATARSKLRGWAREPLLHFVLLGAALFAVSEYLEARASHSLITISRAQQQGIVENYRLQYGVAPTPAELDALVDNVIKEEVFYHEALRLGLDKDDEIIRRRLVQKYEFLQQDLSVAREPSETELQKFYATHEQNYRVPAKLSFSQIYFSVDKGGEQQAIQRAVDALLQLQSGTATRAPELGDRFPGLSDYAAVTATQIGRVFGDRGLAQEVFKGSTDQWQGPYRSAYGWHLVYVTSREPEAAAAYAQVREAVQRDYIEYQRAVQNSAALTKLKQSFTIVRE